MLKPVDYGLPSHFTEWRPHQLEAISKASASRKYAYLLDSPTGSGKSIIGAGVQRVMDRKAIYLVHTKQLEDQLLGDFPYAKKLMGRSNYPCTVFAKNFPTINAEFCTHSKEKPCPQVHKCPYLEAKREALEAPLAVLNYAYYLSEVNYVGGFSGGHILIADEVDALESQLMSFISLTITRKQIERLQLPTPKLKTKFESWVEWAQQILPSLRHDLDELEAQASQAWEVVDRHTIYRKLEIERLIGKLNFFVREVDKNWVWYPGEDRWEFKPVWPAKYTNGVLWKHTDKVLGMSATILDPKQLSTNIGIPSYDYMCLPSPFPKEHRVVYYEPCANLTSKTMDIELPKLNKAMHKIIDLYPHDKILVHTTSYKVRNYLTANPDNNGKRIITHNINDRTSQLDKFMKSKEPLVMLSPSMDRGIDLRDDLCRVIIIAKMPYADLSDPQVSKRVYSSKDGSSWYAHKTISTLIQMSGRGCRSMDDWSKTYILDAQFENLLTKNRQMFPGWFLESLVT